MEELPAFLYQCGIIQAQMLTWPVNSAVDLGCVNLVLAAGQAAQLSELGLCVLWSCVFQIPKYKAVFSHHYL